MFSRLMVGAVIATAVTFGGLAAIPLESDIKLMVMAEMFTPVTLYWEREIERQYPNAVVIMAHGRIGYDGEWRLYPAYFPSITVQDAIARVRVDYPHRRIVLLACNPGGIVIDNPGVIYATRNVWLIPDSVTFPGMDFDTLTHEDLVGSLDEMIHNPW